MISPRCKVCVWIAITGSNFPPLNWIDKGLLFCTKRDSLEFCITSGHIYQEGQDRKRHLASPFSLLSKLPLIPGWEGFPAATLTQPGVTPLGGRLLTLTTGQGHKGPPSSTKQHRQRTEGQVCTEAWGLLSQSPLYSQQLQLLRE